MAKPFKNAPALTEEIDDSFLLAIQAGNAQNDEGLSQMRHLSVSRFRDWMLTGFGKAMNFLGKLTETPDVAAVNDYFIAGASWDIFLENRLYEFNGSAWYDITSFMDQYAKTEELDAAVQRIEQAEQSIRDLSTEVDTKIASIETTKTKIQFSASLDIGEDNEYSVLSLGLVHDDPDIEDGIEVVSGLITQSENN